jgi:hypothetical protein
MMVRAAWIWTLATAAAVLVAGPAQALSIVFDGPGGFGISAEAAEDAAAEGVPIIEVDAIAQAVLLNLTIPAPNVLSSTVVGNPSVSNPNRARSEWSVTNSGAGDLSDVWLVFLNPATYTPTQVGFEIDGSAGWAVVTVFVPDGEDGTDYYYPARFLGDMDSGDTVDFLMRHLVGETLHTQGSNLVLPQYSVGALQGIPVPEPGVLALSVAGFALAAVLRRRSA